MCSLVATHCRRGSCEMAESSREEGILGSPEKKKRKKNSFSNCFPLSCHDMNVRPGTCVPGTVAVAARSSRILGTNRVLFPYFLLGWCPQPPRGGILWFRIHE